MTNMPRVAGMAESLVQIAVDLDPAKDLATITLTGPAMVWFGVGLGASGGHVDPADPSSGLTMAGTNWTIVVLPNGVSLCPPPQTRARTFSPFYPPSSSPRPTN
jgi:hypothetical protein